MFRRKDWMVIIATLLVAAASYGIMVMARGGQSLSGEAIIYVNGALYMQVSLAEAQDIEIAQEDGEVTNIVHVGGGGAYMAFSNCKNQLCLHQGEVTVDNWARRALGRSVICLPNRVVIELALEDSARRIVEEDLADV